MSKETKKQEAIRLAYGDEYERLKEFINCEGVFVGDTDLISDELFDDWQFIGVTPMIKGDRSTAGSRPKTLIGITTNNGWTHIESEADLPTENAYYWIKDKIGNIEICKFKANDKDYYIVWSTQFTHYQPIAKPKPPIY